MSQDTITLSLVKREVVGKGLNQFRNEGQTPAVIHNHGKESIIVSGPNVEMLKVYKQAGMHHPVNLEVVGGEKFMALIKSADFEPKKNQLRHVVFNAIEQDVMQQTEVPIHFMEGEIPAEKAGLLVIRQLEAVEIEALPKDLIDELMVDVTGLTEIGDKVTVADLKAPAGVTILTEAEHPIAVVEEAKIEIEEETPEEEAAEGEEAAAEGGENKDTPEEE